MYFNISSLFLLVTLFISLFFRKMTAGNTNKAFTHFIILTLMTTCVDLLSELYGVVFWTEEADRSIANLINYIYFFLRALFPGAYLILIAHLTGTFDINIKRRWFRLLLILPPAICYILVITNLFHHRMFYIDEHMSYQRGFLIIIFYVTALLASLSDVIYLVHYRNTLEKGKLLTILFLLPANLAGLLVQFILPTVHVEMFATTISLYLLSIMVILPEEMIDIDVGTQSTHSYDKFVRQAFITGQSFSVIFIKIKNHSSLLTLVGSRSTRKFMRHIATTVLRAHKEKEPGTVYYLHNGLFCILYNQPDQYRYALEIANQVNDLLKGSFNINELDLEVQSAIAVVKCPGVVKNQEELTSFAESFDRNLLENETLIVLDSLTPERLTTMQNDVNRIISDAITHNRFKMYYQPIYSVKEKRFCTAEALIRMQDENGNFISPDIFIPEAEKSGAIHPIGNFVLVDVCRFISSQKLDRMGVKFVEINLSVTQCMQKSFSSQITRITEDFHIRPEQISFEITETATDTVQSSVRSNILKLHSASFDLALDDYGTGYSNLSRILNFPFRIIKIDKSFVDRLSDPRMKVIIENTIQMIQGIGAEIVVEGVETKEAADWFIAHNCDYIQGFYFARPMCEEDYIAFLKDHARDGKATG